MVGLGQIAELMLPPYLAHPDIEIVALCDANEERLDRWRAELPHATGTTDLDELLARDDLHVVDVLVPTPLHAEIGRRVLAAGHHMQLQKPITRNLDDCDALLEIAEENGAFIRVLEDYIFFPPLVKLSKKHGVRRFVYASSSSVYGIRDEENVTEELELKPLTDYSKYKAMCEDVLLAAREPGFAVLTIRPATVCGYSPRLRLDLSVNILTNLAVNKREITVFGGSQHRPNLHIQDMTDLYCQTLKWPAEKIDGKVYNAGWQNLSIRAIADLVRAEVGEDVRIVTSSTDDLRSYHVSSEKIRKELGWEPRYTVPDAVRELVAAFQSGKVPNSLSDPRYFNIKTMNAHLAARNQVA